MIEIAGGEVDVEFVRVGYDIATAVATIRASDLPDEFAEYLETGGDHLGFERSR